MSFFFNKSEGDDNLQYDDTAFLHFAISVCAINALIFICFLKNDISKYARSGLGELNHLNIYKKKIKNFKSVKNSYFSSWPFIIKIIIIIFSLSIAYQCFNNVKVDEKMIGFDPYEILQVEFEAPLSAVKKSYRKLALKYHPDRNVGNPEAAAKFIQISKAYECLTDEQAKEKCQKYGNPDGQATFKVGIGLPKAMISSQNQYLVLPAVFIIMLVIIPRLFLAWNSKISMTDEAGLQVQSYFNIFRYFNPKMNYASACWAMGSLRQLDKVIPHHDLNQEDSEVIKKLLMASESITEEEIKDVPPHVLHRIHCFLAYFQQKSNDHLIAQIFPDLAMKLTFFSSYFGRRMLEGKPLYQNPEWIVRFSGLLPIICMISFTKKMFNRSLNIQEVRSIEFLDLNEEEMEIAKANPIPQLHDMLRSKEKVDEFVNKFPKNRPYIKKQIECLPALSLDVRCLIGDEEVEEFSTADFPLFQIKVKKHNKTDGYVTTKDYNFLQDEYFHVVFSMSSSLLMYQSFKFKKDQSETTLKFGFRTPEAKEVMLRIAVIPFCYPNNMELVVNKKMNIYEPPQNENKVEFNREDLEIEKLPKDFWQSLVSMDLQNQSDKEMSDGESDEQSEEEKPRWEEERKV